MTKSSYSSNRQSLLMRVHQFDLLPDSALMNVREISLLSGKSRATLWRDVRDGRLPKPHKIGPKSPRWKVRDVRSFLAGGA
jgi:predicted DNA-binding transcriptional regulator AlpA